MHYHLRKCTNGTPCPTVNDFDQGIPPKNLKDFHERKRGLE